MSGTFGRRSINSGAATAAATTTRVRPPAAADSASQAPAFRRDTAKALRDSLIVFGFMAYLAVQTYTGFVYEVFDVRPRAAVVLDSIVDFLLVSRIGVTAASAVLAALAVGLALFVFIREMKRRI